jgi:preprotein translocase subunit SecE
MTQEEDVKKDQDEKGPAEDAGDEAPVRTSSGEDAKIEDQPVQIVAATSDDAPPESDEEERAPALVPGQLGSKRYVYAAYFAGAIGVAFLASKIISYAWYRLSQYKPNLGEPRDDVVMPIAAVVGVIAAIYYWRRTRARQLAEEVAGEMAKVTWPSRTEISNSTVVVVVTTIVSTIFFALMDRFWSFVTNLVYGS